jgi:hypothetical protein
MPEAYFAISSKLAMAIFILSATYILSSVANRLNGRCK